MVRISLKIFITLSPEGLEAHHEDGLWTLGGSGPHSVANCVLRFDGEQEAGSEAIDGRDTGRPARFL